MKHIFAFIFCLIMISCGCGHKEGEHIPNDTILCVVDHKSKLWNYNVVLHISEWKYKVKFRNIQTGNTSVIHKKLFYDMFNEGDTIYEIVQHCPYYRVELKNR